MFSYTFPYLKHDRFYIPSIPVGLFLGGVWHNVFAYVDSGAQFSVFDTALMGSLGLSYQHVQRIQLTVGDGDMLPVYLHRVRMSIGGERFIAPLGFSEKLKIGFNLLGRSGIFNRFDVTFSDAKRLVTFTKIESASS